MSQLKGETTVFYSTHILDDVERVSDRVAILDHGRLVREALTADLLSSFTLDQIRVVIGGADDATGPDLAALPGVKSVEPSGATETSGRTSSAFTRTRLCPSSGRSRATRPTAT